ncbi:hypothetical protein OUZ56_011072 [Daphnia magna]|uniref:Uncharacterized protein n=1 Tax=Daphnia magna TaxID=35525 RepID=A0ABQ9YZB0_9CRUS|nr:hypothetical protein OUZ56_011072 [Daphnia magna]
MKRASEEFGALCFLRCDDLDNPPGDAYPANSLVAYRSATDYTTKFEFRKIKNILCKNRLPLFWRVTVSSGTVKAGSVLNGRQVEQVRR